MPIDYDQNDITIDNLQVILSQMRQLNQQHKAGSHNVVDVTITYTAAQMTAVEDRYTALKVAAIAEFGNLP